MAEYEKQVRDVPLSGMEKATMTSGTARFQDGMRPWTQRLSPGIPQMPFCGRAE